MPSPTSAPVRLKDIARDLNVSVMTVSKVVRGCADVGPKTRSRVMARIKELNYQPNWVARSLAARRTFIVGLIVPDLMHSFFAEVAKGISTTLRPLGYDLVICNSEEDAELERSEIERLLARQVDGLVLASCQPPSAREAFAKIDARGTPYVLIDRNFGSGVSYVGTDDEAIGRIATTHLIERGCRRIVHIAGPQHTSPGAGRLNGYREALRKARIPVDESQIAHARDDASGYDAMRKLMAEGSIPDGVFGYNDAAAAGAMKAVLEAGMRIPQQVKVIGAGNVHYSDLLRVPLSTVDQRSADLGKSAGEILSKLLNSKRKRAPVTVLIEPRIIARESSGAGFAE